MNFPEPGMQLVLDSNRRVAAVFCSELFLHLRQRRLCWRRWTFTDPGIERLIELIQI